MAQPAKPAETKRRIRDSDTAPFIYFDTTGAYGVTGGAVQIELVARILVPLVDGGVSVELLTTGRLRCTPAGARHLQESIQKALDMLSHPQPAPAAGTATLN
jgi:hypothetical protein